MHSRNNVIILFSTRICRLFAFGFLSVILVFYLIDLGFKENTIGFLLTLALIGDVIISLWITTHADRMGRKKMLVLGALLMVFAGSILASAHSFLLIAIAAIVGVISPSGNEVGPFLAIEQAGLAQTIADKNRTKVFAWYHLVGSLSTAFGSLAGGGLMHVLAHKEMSALAPYRICLLIYIGIGLLIGFLFLNLTSGVEATAMKNRDLKDNSLGIYQSRRIILKLGGLFTLDAFAGGLIVQSIIVFWFHVRFGADPAVLGSIFFGANILAGFSALLAAKIADRFGLINTMVFTHIPSNVLLMLVPLMPGLLSAVIVLLLRFSISQMDVPTRQSYTVAVVSPDERSAAAGFTNISRSLGAALAPSLSGFLIAIPALMGSIFFLSGGLKIIYDLLLYRTFKKVKPPEEKKQ